MAEIIPAGKAMDATRITLARSGIGIAYKTGTPRPDLRDAEYLKKALLEAPSIAYLPAGSTGAHINAVAMKLGILDQLKAKAVVLESSSRDASSSAGAAAQNTVLQAVLDGKARFGIQAVSNILPVAGLEWVPFPSELQQFRTYSAAIAAASQQGAAAADLLKFLADPGHAPLIRFKVMEPG
jgi:molybdate transport system substrate-binding protein